MSNHQFVTIRSMLWFPTHISNNVHILKLCFINKCVPKWVTISLTLFWLQDYVWTHFSHLWSVATC